MLFQFVFNGLSFHTTMNSGILNMDFATYSKHARSLLRSRWHQIAEIFGWPMWSTQCVPSIWHEHYHDKFQDPVFSGRHWRGWTATAGLEIWQDLSTVHLEMARSANLTTQFLVFKEDLVEAAILAVRRSLWEAANADFAAAVLIEALIYVFTTTMWNQWTKHDTAQQNTCWSGWKRRGTRQTLTGLEQFGRPHICNAICKHLWICFWLQQLHAQAAAESLRDPTLSKQRRRMMLALVEARWMLGQFGALHGKLVGAVSQAGSHGIPCHGYISYIHNMYTHYNIHIIIYIYIIILLLLYNYIII